MAEDYSILQADESHRTLNRLTIRYPQAYSLLNILADKLSRMQTVHEDTCRQVSGMTTVSMTSYVS
jgi:hypothetical protein